MLTNRRGGSRQPAASSLTAAGPLEQSLENRPSRAVTDGIQDQCVRIPLTVSYRLRFSTVNPRGHRGTGVVQCSLDRAGGAAEPPPGAASARRGAGPVARPRPRP